MISSAARGTAPAPASTLKVRTSQPTMKALVFAVLSHPLLKR
jgi:hypothetical protein